MCARPAVFVSAEHVCTDLAAIGTEPLNATKTFNPHAVLINLGQNDYGVGHIPTSAVWARAYRAFVEEIMGTYNDPGRAVQFFLVCGGNDSKYCEDTKQAVVGMQGRDGCQRHRQCPLSRRRGGRGRRVHQPHH